MMSGTSFSEPYRDPTSNATIVVTVRGPVKWHGNIGKQAMPEPHSKNNPPAIYATMQATETPDSFTAIFTVTRPEQFRIE